MRRTWLCFEFANSFVCEPCIINKVCVMKDIDHIVDLVAADLAKDPESIKNIKNMTLEDMRRQHFGLGMQIRNKFKLWDLMDENYKPMVVNGADCNPIHPDNISDQILIKLWRKINDKDA